MDGGLDAQTIRLEGNIVSRTAGVRGIIARNAGPERSGLCIDEPFSAKFRGVKARCPILGSAVRACELAGLPWSAIDLGRLKVPATGKENARKPLIKQPDSGLRRKPGGCRLDRRFGGFALRGTGRDYRGSLDLTCLAQEGRQADLTA
jgi:hypothetical protein